jgi:hypothetical protein
METPGTDEPSQTAEPDAPEPSGAPTPPPTAAPGPPTTAPIPLPTPPASGPPHGGARGPSGPDGPSIPGGSSGEGGMFSGGLGGDWPAQAADAIVNVVGAVRDRTTGPITTIARGVVFGFFAAVLGIAVAVMLIIAAIRLLDEVLPSGVWLAYLVLGTVVVIAGALVFRKRNQPAAAAGNTGRP